MTLPNAQTIVSYVGNGVTLEFPVPFVFFGPTELEVISRVNATGVETVLALTTNYTVTGGNGTTGTVLANVAPASTVTWFIRRVTARTQEIDYVPNDTFPADTLERGLDRRAAVEQELLEILSRCLIIPKTDTGINPELASSVARALKFLSFDANGQPTVATAVTGTTVSLAMEPVVGASTLIAALQALGIWGDISLFRQMNFR